MGGEYPTEYCKRCDSPIRAGEGRCSWCDSAATPVGIGWNDLRITTQELAAAADLVARSTSSRWGWVAPHRVRPEPRPLAGIPDSGLESAAGATDFHPVSAEDRRPAEGEPLAVGSGARPAAPEIPVLAVREAPPVDPETLLEDDGEEPPMSTIRPPVLASAALQRELFPTEPGRGLIRVVAAVLGVAGVVGTMSLLGFSPGGVPICTGFAALTTLAVAPMAYLARAAAFALFSGLGLFAANIIHFGTGPGRTGIGLLLVVLVLGQGLHLRSWHRASQLARVLVGIGVLAGAVWLYAIGSFADLGVLEGSFRNWAPRVIVIPFGLLLMLALLAFMDPRTTGGCGAWAALLWAWYAAYLALCVAVEVMLAAELPPYQRPGDTALVQLANGLLSPVFALALAQLAAGSLAVAKVHSAERVRPEPAPEGAYLEPP